MKYSDLNHEKSPQLNAKPPVLRPDTIYGVVSSKDSVSVAAWPLITALADTVSPVDAIVAGITSVPISFVHMPWILARLGVWARVSVPIVRIWGVMQIGIMLELYRCRFRGKDGVLRSVRLLVRIRGTNSLQGSGRVNGE